MLITYFCSFLFYCARLVNGDVFSAVADLAQVVSTEEILIDLLDAHIKSEETKLNILKRYYESFQKHKPEDPERYVSNPINAFALIKRLVIDWKEIEALIRDEEISDKIVSIKDGEPFPDYEDLLGSALAIKRLQETYNLSTTSLARGEISGIKYGPEMYASDCFELGKVLYKNGKHDNAQKWMVEAKQRLELEDPPNLDKQTLEDYLTSSVLKQRIIRPGLAAVEKLKEMATSAKRSLGKAEDEPKVPKLKKEIGYIDIFIKYDMNLSKTMDESSARHLINELCRGNVSPSDEQQSKLRCYYQSNSHFLLIGPIKVEELYSNPDIIIFHDAITDDEMDKLKEMSMSKKLARAKVVDSGTRKGKVVDFRVSKHVGFKDDDSTLIKVITKRMEVMTGLSMNTAEFLAIANYGIGGFYSPHFDGLTKHIPANDTRGDRVATLMFYLSDVELGGATIFPFINLVVRPRKGSAILWYNLLSSGDGDKYTIHSACPVLLGSKWVATKWIRERGQMFQRPCNLKQPPAERILIVKP